MVVQDLYFLTEGKSSRDPLAGIYHPLLDPMQTEMRFWFFLCVFALSCLGLGDSGMSWVGMLVLFLQYC